MRFGIKQKIKNYYKFQVMLITKFNHNAHFHQI